jgi:hypothetical protein
VLFLLEKNLVKVDWLIRPSDVKSISYNLEKLPAFYEIKRKEDPSFKTKREKIERYREIILKELSILSVVV